MGSIPTAADYDSGPKQPWIKTPCIPSRELSRIAGCNIYLKLDNLQPSGAFKSRGIGNLMTRAVASGPPDVHFYCSSAGNAGLACATSAVALGRPATIVIPTTSPPLMRAKLLALGATVHAFGSSWADADRHMREEHLSRDPSGVYVPPFDHPHVWDGAATVVDELREQLGGEGVPIHGIVCSVGGGGLVNGIMQAVESAQWPGGDEGKPAVLAVETAGADALNASVRAGEHVSLPAITSIATSLGALRVSEQTYRWATREGSRLVSHVVSDADAAISCVRFADDARLLVEVSCGATLAVVYNGDLRRQFGAQLSDDEWSRRNIVLEVCGGSGVSLGTLAAYREKYAGQSSIKVE